jgi:transposase InsO family protein
MKYEFMASHESEHSVNRMCRVLGVERSGYYAWRGRAESQRAQANQKLLLEIRTEHQISRQSYGSPRIHEALQKRGIPCGRHRIARLMRLDGMVGRKRRKYRPHTTQRNPQAAPAPNLLGQDFTCQQPNEKWVVDITYIDTSEGWLYLACVMDLYSRRIVGWSMSARPDASLVKDALVMAIEHRDPPQSLLHHSDQGSTYTSEEYKHILRMRGFQISESRVGNCYDNAVMESFFATLKLECADHQFTSRTEARTAIFEYIEGWYNHQRLHSSLDYASPVEFETNFAHECVH